VFSFTRPLFAPARKAEIRNAFVFLRGYIETNPDILGLQRQIGGLIDKYTNYPKSDDRLWWAHQNLKTLVTMLNQDAEVIDLAERSGIDEVRILSRGNKRACRVTLNFNRELGLHRRWWRDADEADVEKVVLSDKEHKPEDRYHEERYSVMATYAVDSSEAEMGVKVERFQNALIDFFEAIERELRVQLRTGKTPAPAPHVHLFQHVWSNHFPEEAGKSVIIYADVFATFRDFHECSCGKTQLRENTGFI
jgi:hypothetical protein